MCAIPEYENLGHSLHTFLIWSIFFSTLQLDFDESVIEGRCVVKHNVDEHLDEMRRTYQGLDSFLSQIAKEISETIPTEFTHAINVIYFPQLGYLIAVPMNAKWQSPEDFELEGLSFQVKDS